MLKTALDIISAIGFVAFWLLVCFGIGYLIDSMIRITARSEFYALDQERRKEERAERERERLAREHQDELRRIRDLRSAE